MSNHILTMQNVESIEIGVPKNILSTQNVHHRMIMAQNIQHDQLNFLMNNIKRTQLQKDHDSASFCAKFLMIALRMTSHSLHALILYVFDRKHNVCLLLHRQNFFDTPTSVAYLAQSNKAHLTTYSYASHLQHLPFNNAKVE